MPGHFAPTQRCLWTTWNVAGTFRKAIKGANRGAIKSNDCQVLECELKTLLERYDTTSLFSLWFNRSCLKKKVFYLKLFLRFLSFLIYFLIQQVKLEPACNSPFWLKTNFRSLSLWWFWMWRWGMDAGHEDRRQQGINIYQSAPPSCPLGCSFWNDSNERPFLL